MNIENEILANPILRNVLDKFKNQQVKGLVKYGETVNPKSYNAVAWLLHLQEELIDATVYSEVLIEVVSQIVEENKRLREALEFYADEKNHTEPRCTKIFGDVFYDMGEIARKALEESQYARD